MTRTHAEIWSETPLHAAARLGDRAALDAALAAGGDAEARDVLGFTPLHVAAIEGHAEVAVRLLAAGAAVDARAKEGVTPLMLACARGRLEAAGWDPAAVAAETPEEALRHEEARGLYPVHRGTLQKLAAEAAARRRGRMG